MPGLTLLSASQPLLGAALAVATPQPASTAVAAPGPALLPLTWSLAADPQASMPPVGDPETPPSPPPLTDALVGEIIVEGEVGPPKSDPMEAINEDSYRLTQAVDQAAVEPVANAYRDGLPEPVRDGLANVVRNLGEPSNALNFLLQGKVGKAFGSLGRLAINSTVGVGGLFDVAGKKAGLPYRRNGFANTLGYYGAGPAPYLYLPVTGATTARDLAGSTLDQLLLPLAVGKPFNRPAYAGTYFLVNGLDQRLAFDAEIASIRNSDDPYRLRRETYFAQRRADIAALRGEPLSEEDRLWMEELEALKKEQGGCARGG
jgi:phospholipid-binding lipoprotein MlaA